MSFEKTAIVLDRLLKTKELVVGFKITGNATPASKTHEVDLPEVAILRSEGKTATADAVVDCSSIVTTAADANGIFALVIDGSKLSDAPKDLVHVEIVGKAGESATAAVTKHAVTSGCLIMTIDTSANLTSANFDAFAVIKYLVK